MEKGKIKIEGKSVIISVNPEIYPLDVIYSAAYVFLEKAYILLDEELDKKISVELRFKEEGGNLEKLGGEFFNELLNYAFYKKQVEKNSLIVQAILGRSLITNSFPFEEGSEIGEIEDLGDNEDIEDSEEIAIPWEEKYGDKKE